uniref:HAT C-terminal dimerisation domain-containing protein n=1 Tax=Amphimedon queenslandica TaxID=400682 RepID=A0A1X7TFT5_AMPQE
MWRVFGKVLLAKNETRWNSQLLMVRRLMNRDDTQDINNVIEKRDLALSTGDKFEEVTKLVQGERVLKDSLHKRLGYIRSDPLFIISTILDPEFKLSWVFDNTEMVFTKQVILKELEKIALHSLQTDYSSPNNDNAASNDEDEDGDSEPVTKRTLFSFMAKTHISREARSAQQEIDDYLLATHTKEEIKAGALEYWRKNGSQFPYLRKLAEQYLSVTATLAPIERVFSTAGKIIRHDSNDNAACSLEPEGNGNDNCNGVCKHAVYIVTAAYFIP